MLSKKIDEMLLEEQEARGERVRSGKWSPSSFGYCFRKQFFNRQNITPSNPVDVRTLRVFKAGKLFHDFAQGLLPKGDCEVKVETDDVLGFADYVSEDCVYDIKSQHSGAFDYMDVPSYDINKERMSNILQVMTYVYLLGKKWGRLVFISKDDLRTKEYGFHIDQWKGQVYKELEVLRTAWETKELPPPEPRVFGTDKKTGEPNECKKYCVYRDHCYKLQGKE
jgi:hypothetical protein